MALSGWHTSKQETAATSFCHERVCTAQNFLLQHCKKNEKNFHKDVLNTKKRDARGVPLNVEGGSEVPPSPFLLHQNT